MMFGSKKHSSEFEQLTPEEQLQLIHERESAAEEARYNPVMLEHIGGHKKLAEYENDTRKLRKLRGMS